MMLVLQKHSSRIINDCFSSYFLKSIYVSISELLSKLKGGDIDYKDIIYEFSNSEDSEPVTEELITREIFESYNKEIIEEESDELDVQEEI